MSETNQPTPDRDRFWKVYVVPTAIGLRTLFWNLLWFAIFVCVVFSYNPFRQGNRSEDRATPVVQPQPVPQQPAAQQ